MPPAQYKSIQDQLSSAKTQAEQIAQGVAKLSKSSAPSSADKITPMEEPQLPIYKYTTPDISLASSTGAGLKTSNDETQRMIDAETQRQVASLQNRQKESQSFFSSLLNKGSNIRENATTTAEDKYGLDIKKDLADKRTKQAEYAKLEEDYNSTLQKRDEEIARIQENAVGGVGSGTVDSAITKIEKDYSSILNAKAATLQAKASYIQVIQGNITEAQNLINQSVNNAVADYQNEVNIWNAAYSDNKSLFDKIDSTYHDAFLEGLKQREKNLENAQNDADNKAKLLLEGAKMGVDLSSYMTRPLAEMQKAYATQVSSASGTGSTNFMDIMQESINNDATPEQAAREAAQVSEAAGIQVDQETLNQWTNIARKLRKNVTTSQTSDNTQTSSITSPLIISGNKPATTKTVNQGMYIPESNKIDFSKGMDVQSSFFANLFQ